MALQAHLTPDIQTTIVEALEKGAYRITAAHLAGIHRHTLEGWVKRGDAALALDPIPELEQPYAEFARAVQTAEAKAEMAAIDKLLNAKGKNDAKGAAIWLERRHRDRWGSHRSIELTGAGGGPVQHGVVVLPAQRIAELGTAEVVPAGELPEHSGSTDEQSMDLSESEAAPDSVA